MALNLSSLTRRSLAAVFRLGEPVVRAGVYYRPASFNAATGQMISAEVAVACSFIGAPVVSANYLGLAALVPGTERLLIRSADLAAMTAPGKGDYVVENGTAIRRNIEGARLDPSGEFHTLQAVRSLDEDWGDLTAQTVAEDWADLTSATVFEDWMTIEFWDAVERIPTEEGRVCQSK